MQYPVSMHLYCVSITYEAVEGYMKSPLEAFNVPAGQSVKWVNYLSPGKMVLPIADEKKISQIDLTRKVKMFWKFRSEILVFHTCTASVSCLPWLRQHSAVRLGSNRLLISFITMEQIPHVDCEYYSAHEMWDGNLSLPSDNNCNIFTRGPSK